MLAVSLRRRAELPALAPATAARSRSKTAWASRFADPRQQHAEFVAAQPRDHVIAPQLTGQCPGRILAASRRRPRSRLDR